MGNQEVTERTDKREGGPSSSRPHHHRSKDRSRSRSRSRSRERNSHRDRQRDRSRSPKRRSSHHHHHHSHHGSSSRSSRTTTSHRHESDAYKRSDKPSSTRVRHRSASVSSIGSIAKSQASHSSSSSFSSKDAKSGDRRHDREKHSNKEKERSSHRDRPSEKDRDRHSQKRSDDRERHRDRSRDRSRDRHQHDHHHRRHRDDHHESREERRDRKRRKREKKEQESGSKGKTSAALTNQWGRYGVISEMDLTSKFEAEFRAWLVEERHINPETISKQNERKEASRFVEDFNTATLPHEKYYNLEAHERKMAAIRSGETLVDQDTYDPRADEEAAKALHRKSVLPVESHLSRSQVEELRRVQNERVEAAKMKQMGLKIRSNMGVRMDGTVFDK